MYSVLVCSARTLSFNQYFVPFLLSINRTLYFIQVEIPGGDEKLVPELYKMYHIPMTNVYLIVKNIRPKAWGLLCGVDTVSKRTLKNFV